MTQYNILVIEDNPGDARLIREYLSHPNGAEYVVEWRKNLTEGVQRVKTGCFDIALLDLGLPECRGKETFNRFIGEAPRLPVVVLTGMDDRELAVESVQGGAQDYLVKSELSELTLRKALQYAIERWKFTRAYQDSEEKFRLIAETSQDFIFQLSAQGEVLYASPAIQSISGYKPDEVLNHHFSEYISEQDKEKALDIFQRVITGDQVDDFELTLEDKTGGSVSLEVNTSLFKIDEEHVGIQGIARDISQRKKREQELRQSEREYRTLFENLQDVFYRADLEGNVTMVSPSAEEMLGYTPDEIVGMNLIEEIYYRRDDAMEFWEQMQTDGTIRSFETQVVRKDGAIIWVMVNAQLMRDADQNPTGIEGIVWDITSQKNLENQLRRRAEMDEAVAEASRHFIANIEADLDRVLKTLAEAAKVNRAYIFQFSKNRIKVSNTHEWCAEDTTPQMENLQEIPTTAMEWWMQKILTHENIVLNSLDDLPEKAVAEKEILEPQGIKSLLAVPIESGNNKVLGFMGFDDTEEERKWEPEEIQALRVLAEMIGFYLERQRAAFREQIFTDLGHQLNDATTPGEAAHIIADAADELIGWDACSVDSYEQETDNIYPLHNVDIVDGVRQDVPPVVVGESPGPVSRQTLKEGGQLILREPENGSNDNLQPFGDASRRSASLMFVPIRHKTQPIGILSIQSYEYQNFDEDDLETLQALADHCAGALERTQAELALKESERDYREIFENMQEGFFRLDADGIILRVNPRMAEILEYDSVDNLLGKNVTDLHVYNNTDHDDFLKVLHEQGEVTNFLNSWSTETGRQIEVRKNVHTVTDENGNLLYYEGTVSDITEQKELERQLIHAQKMESLGQIAGGIAHDFNNVMATISGANQMLELLARDYPDTFDKYLKMVSSSIERGKSITNRMLTFTRTEHLNFQPISAMHYLEEIREITGTTLPKNVLVRLHPYDGNDKVIGDRGQLQQVLMNLCINAADAMEGGGQIDLSLADAPGEEVRKHDVDPALDYLCISVSDNGSGIPEENLETIFEPFFTTKEPGKGTGLGLAVVYKIIRNHGGWIDVESIIGEGTTFTIGLPLAGERNEESGKTTEKDLRQGKGEHILVIDDEKDIREIVTKILTDHGYKVTAAFSGKRSLEILQDRDEPFALIVTDLGMPELSGRELIKMVLKRFPGQRIIGNTGYLEAYEQEQLKEIGFNAIIQKPFQIDELLQTVGTVLEE